MSDPNFDTYVSVMHALFALEDQYGLHAYRDESGVPQLMFKDKGHDSLNMLDHIGTWADMYQKFRNEEITEKEIFKTGRVNSQLNKKKLFTIILKKVLSFDCQRT
mgnify:CR=1 FL=1